MCLSVVSELEEDVARLQKTSQSGPGPSVSLRDVEAAAVDLRKVGQAMAVLKGVPQEQNPVGAGGCWG